MRKTYAFNMPEKRYMKRQNHKPFQTSMIMDSALKILKIVQSQANRANKKVSAKALNKCTWMNTRFLTRAMVTATVRPATSITAATMAGHVSVRRFATMH